MNTYYYMLPCGGYSICRDISADLWDDFKVEFNEIHKDHTIKHLQVYLVLETKVVNFNE